VGLAVTVEVLLLRPTATERALPQLIQVRVDVAVAVAGSAQDLSMSVFQIWLVVVIKKNLTKMLSRYEVSRWIFSSIVIPYPYCLIPFLFERKSEKRAS
jgi:hypothetical protein